MKVLIADDKPVSIGDRVYVIAQSESFFEVIIRGEYSGEHSTEYVVVQGVVREFSNNVIRLLFEMKDGTTTVNSYSDPNQIFPNKKMAFVALKKIYEDKLKKRESEMSSYIEFINKLTQEIDQ